MIRRIHKHRKLILIVTIVLIVVLMIIRGTSRVTKRIGKEFKAGQNEIVVKKTLPPVNSGPVLAEELDNAIHLSASYLRSVCDDSGQFTYYINLNPDIALKPKYNILRHAGSIYSLAMYEAVFPDKDTRAVIGRAVDFLKKSSLASLPGRDDMLAVWSYPEINGSDKPAQVKLGGTGLSLVALTSVERVMPGTTSLETLRELGNFILYMQKEDGSFYSKYYPEQGGRNDEWTSLYYPGEAALGLLMLYERDPSQKWLDAAAKAIAYLARLREGRPIVEPDHWALIATERLMPLYYMTNQHIPHKAVIEHAAQIGRSMYIQSAEFPAGSIFYGCLTNDGRTTPTATRLEGLFSALEFLPGDMQALRQDITVRVFQGIRFLVNSQVRSGKYAGAIPRAVTALPPEHPVYSEAFNRRATEVRIDYVQHALAAMLKYRELVNDK